MHAANVQAKIVDTDGVKKAQMFVVKLCPIKQILNVHHVSPSLCL